MTKLRTKHIKEKAMVNKCYKGMPTGKISAYRHHTNLFDFLELRTENFHYNGYIFIYKRAANLIFLRYSEFQYVTYF